MELRRHARRRVVSAIVAAAMVSGGCANRVEPSTPASQPSTGARQVSDIQGAFQLIFELPTTTYRAGEPIEGRATLAAIGGAPVAFGSSGGGPFVFNFTELTGRRDVGGAMTADCAPYLLEPGSPMTSAITKSGGFSSDDPDAPFYRAFLTDPTVTLPAGDWRITASAVLVEGVGCSGASRDLAASIVVHVVP
jgi:hypothetical protein